MNPATPGNIASGTAAFVALLAVAVVVAVFARRLRVPAAVAFVAVGLFFPPFGPIAVPFAFGATLLFVYLPPLIFEGSWNVDIGALRRTAVAVAMLAVPGVIVTTLVVAGGVAAAKLLPLVAAFMLGAVVSATDPVAVIAIFRSLRIPVDLQTIVEGESIANDGIALVLYGLGLEFAAGPAGVAYAGAALHAVVAVAGGIALGIIAAVVIGFAIRFAEDRATELAGTVVLAYASFGAATALGLSGVFATAAAAVTFRARSREALTAQGVEEVDRFWEAIAFIANALVFLSTGLVIQLPRILHEPALVIVALVCVFASRAILSYVMLPLAGVGKRHAAWRTVTFLSGMRGALSLALALGLPATFPYRAQIIDATFAIVFVTLVVQGALVERVLVRLPLRR
ncbi:MAG: cation:proton antiporter [Candidatus Velthaea sp.]